MDWTYPKLNSEHFAETRSGLHAFAKLLGAYTSACAPRRKHWWHISLKPVVDGFSTGALQNSGHLFELILNFQSLTVNLRIAGEDAHEFPIQGESAKSLKDKLTTLLSRHSITIELNEEKIDSAYYEIDRELASRLGQVYGRLAQCLARLRSGIPVETSPIQLWPHHFDLAMLVLTGRKIPGQDPENEEYSDEQLNFGFVPGDEGIGEPYFFITLYAQAERLANVPLPDEAYFHTEGWSGIVMLYDLFRKNPQAETMLLNLWQSAWQAVQEEIMSNTELI
jgi:hypothetical protein